MQTIIIATDFSDASRNAAKYAAALAQPLGTGRIVLYHSYDNNAAVTEVPVAEATPRLTHEGSLKALEQIKQELQPVVGNNAGVDIELAANGLPLVHGVNQLAEERHADLVVAGATGKTNLEQALVGSNTVSLASEVNAPLLIVPKDSSYTAISKIVFA